MSQFAGGWDPPEGVHEEEDNLYTTELKYQEGSFERKFLGESRQVKPRVGRGSLSPSRTVRLSPDAGEKSCLSENAGRATPNGRGVYRKAWDPGN